MAHPKSRISKQRRRKRRTHYKLTAPNVVNCSNCGSAVLSHHVCGSCGFYNGRQILKGKNSELEFSAE
jgi:large subunit ribosomal protein L32